MPHEKGANMEIDEILGDFPEEIKANILSDPAEFKHDLDIVLKEEERFFIIADKQHLLSPDYAPKELTELDGKGIRTNKKGMKIESAAFENLLRMIKEGEKEGLDITVGSAYRDYAYQVNLYNYYISVYGKEETDTFSAPPGASQHQLGTAVDFSPIDDSFYDSPEEKWIRANGYKYGFSLSFPKGMEDMTGYAWEPWHYRYVTANGAAFQKKYFSDIQHYMLLFLDRFRHTSERCFKQSISAEAHKEN